MSPFEASQPNQAHVDKKRRYRSRVHTYLRPEEWAAFLEWLNVERTERKVSIAALSRTLGLDYDGGTSYVRRIFQGKIRPTPATIKKLSLAIRTSWTAAFARAGFYEELLAMMADLVRLGERWCADDSVYPWGEHRWEFRSLGVLAISGNPALEAIKTSAYARRYHAGCYESEDVKSDARARSFGRLQAGETVEWQPEDLESVSHFVVLPKPMAAAILIGAVGFPRRGDYWKDGAQAYAAHLLEAATPLIEMAQETQDRATVNFLPPLLQLAARALGDEHLQFGTRRGIAAEYIVAWADSICAPYAEYARLAGFACWGELGSSLSTATVFAGMPELRRATLPDVSEFAVSQRVDEMTTDQPS